MSDPTQGSYTNIMSLTFIASTPPPPEDTVSMYVDSYNILLSHVYRRNPSAPIISCRDTIATHRVVIIITVQIQHAI